MIRRDRRAAVTRKRTAGSYLLRGGIVATLALTLAMTGAGITFALWSSSASLETDASTAELALTAENFSSTDFTFRNHALKTRSSVTITNTTNTASELAADLTLAFGTTAGSSAALAQSVSVKVWRVSAGTNCTTATLADSDAEGSGTWALFPSITETALLKHGQQAQYCIESAATDGERSGLASVTGSATISPQITAKLTAGNFTATAVKVASQKTNYIYPAHNQPAPSTWYNVVNTGANQRCVDVGGGNGANGTAIINYRCKLDGTLNQDWGLVTASYAPRYVKIVTRYTSGSSPAQNLAIGPTSSGAVQVQTPDANSRAQQWQFQLRSNSGTTDTFQIVNRDSGLCLQGNATEESAIVLRECDGSALQGFTLAPRLQVAPVLTLACVDTGAGVTFSWTGKAIEEYKLEVAQVGSSTFVPLKTVPFGSESVMVLPGDMASGAPTGSYAVRAKWRNHELGSTTLWNEKAGAEPSLACKAQTDLAVAVDSVTPGTVEAGDSPPVVWEFTVTNTGKVSSAAGNIAVQLPAATGFSVSSSLGTCSIAGSAGSCMMNNLAPGASGTVTVTGSQKIVAPVSVKATVALTGTVTDINSSNNSDSRAVAVQDTTAPTKPALELSNTTATSTTLTWSGSTDAVGVTEYRIYRNESATPIKVQLTAAGPMYIDTGLQPNTKYTYSVAAVDAQGHQSVHSDAKSTTTLQLNLEPDVGCTNMGLFQDGFRLDWAASDLDDVEYIASWRTNINIDNWVTHPDAVSSGQVFVYDNGGIRIGSNVKEIRIDAVYGGITYPGTVRKVSYGWFFGDLAKCGS